VDLIEHCRSACDDLIDVAGRATIQAVLELSAQQVADPSQQGKYRTGWVVWYGHQSNEGRPIGIDLEPVRRVGRRHEPPLSPGIADCFPNQPAAPACD
jgi:hypothetical protein